DGEFAATGERTVEIVRRNPSSILLRAGARLLTGLVASVGDGLHVGVQGRSFTFHRASGLTLDGVTAVDMAIENHQSVEAALQAPFPAMIVTVDVRIGDRVEAGQRLLVIEAMKTEQALLAPTSGRVARLPYGVGDQAPAGAVLVELVT
ncbi:MAG TPA: acetyl-CoA carboxylase biotin carboxyl carrier protein subunit, partial [Chloroflexota bacterium]|nr:acetyl-CoA carboxylase biotin carboxyl carrier protein subunit [Chloroflexota bacterium]